MPRFPLSVSAVLPAFDEEEALPRTVRDLAAALEALVSEWEIVVVDDGSTDGTSAACAALQGELGDRFRAVRLEPNQGYGAALAAGFAAARHPWTFVTDADGQFDPRQLDRLLVHAPRHRLVIGRRLARAEGRGRGFTSAAFNLLARAAFGVRARDIDCAFKLLDTSVLRAIPLTCRRYLVNTEILHSFARLGIEPLEVGVEHRARLGGASKIDLRDVPRTLLEVARLRFRLWFAPPLRLPAHPDPACGPGRR